MRISTSMPSDDSQFRLRRQEEGLSAVQSRIAGNTRIHELRDDPLAASHGARWQSYLTRLERFEKNSLMAAERYNFVDSSLRSANDIMQRVRELAVQGANGVYTQADLRAMGGEVNELLKELVSIANQSGPDGTRLFGGDKAFTEPFRVIEGALDGSGEKVPLRVEYRGAGATRETEIHDNVYSALDMSGGRAFWAEKMQVQSAVNADNWRAMDTTSFFVDGHEIVVNTGDTVTALAEKINASPAPVSASIDPERGSLTLTGTDAHLITLEDGKHADGSSAATLRDLGLLRGAGEQGAPDWAPDAKITDGRSLFDAVIDLRDAMYKGDTLTIGGRALGGVDGALTNLGARLAEMGSRAERVEAAWKRLNEEIPLTTATLSRETGLNLADAALELAQRDAAHKAALQVAAKILPQTLLDFLR